MYYTVIQCSPEQVAKLFSKHTRNRITAKFFVSERPKGIGFVTLQTMTGKKICYQLRDNKPSFVEYTGFNNIRYDINNLSEYPELEECLRQHGIKARDAFWKGAAI